MNALMPVRYSKILHKSSQMLLQVMSAQSHTLVMLYLQPTHTNSNHFVNLINPYSWAEPNRSILVDIKSAYTEFPFSVNKSKEIINGQVISITTDPGLNKDWKKTTLKMLTKKYPVGGYKYIRQMAEILKETDASTNNIAFYEAIVWFNLNGTDAWKNMPLEEKLPIEKIQKNFGF